jgi:hypothetical protein
VPPNITIIALPLKSPELNPVENVWQFMRDNWLSNRVSKSYDDLVNHCCEAWNKLVDQPLADHVHRIVPMGARVLINGIWYKKDPLFKLIEEKFVLLRQRILQWER